MYISSCRPSGSVTAEPEKQPDRSAGESGAIRSSKFTLGGDGYISFMIGAGNGNSYVALCDGNTDEELITVHNDYFSDPALALTLLRTYMDASAYIGKEVYMKIVDGHAAGVISASTYWGENLPYNQAGDYHLDGWNNGIGEPEGWQVRSSNFTLAGSGFISVRMGGNAAAVRVYKADGTEIGCYRQTRFADRNFPSLAAGGSWADMGSYVIDLSEHIGEELYIVLCDEVIDGGWAHAFFDEVVTYYETAPDYANLYDVVADGGSAEEVHIPWQLAENLK